MRRYGSDFRRGSRGRRHDGMDYTLPGTAPFPTPREAGMETEATATRMSTSPGNRKLAWAFLAAAWLANAAGYLFGLYPRFAWFDEAVHAYTTFALTLVLSLYLYGAVLTGARSHALLLVLVVASVGLALGALWEVGEWGFDQLVAGDVIRGKRDTILDLVMDAGGALAAGWVAVGMVRR